MPTLIQHQSPLIKQQAWGALWLETQEQSFKDAKLYPGGACTWDWQETGTRHDPGIQIADVQDLVAHEADTVILSTGVNQKLQVPKETVAYLQNRGIAVTVAQTDDAVALYNTYVRQGYAVGALIHSTC